MKVDTNQYRTLYIATYAEAIYVLHCFIIKTQRTNKQDIEIAKARLKTVKEGRR
ncbi:MAG: type II toxin-antitoxin system RelE/ParE family toxin [Gammaproteobacteria bacterium]